MRAAILGALAAICVASVACGSGDEDSGRGGVGAKCSDGRACETGLVCFVEGEDPAAGTCSKPPAACGSDVKCSCLDELTATCPAGSSCMGLLGDYVVACTQGTARRQKGETCSSVRRCDSGLYCMVATAGKPGTCLENPVACGTQPSCDCFDAIRKSCAGSGSGCSVMGDLTVITCH